MHLCYNMDECWKYAGWKKPVTIGWKTLFPWHVQNREVYRDRNISVVVWGLSWGELGTLLKVKCFYWGWWKWFWGWLHNSINILKTQNQIQDFKWVNCMAYYISVQLSLKRVLDLVPPSSIHDRNLNFEL